MFFGGERRFAVGRLIEGTEVCETRLKKHKVSDIEVDAKASFYLSLLVPQKKQLSTYLLFGLGFDLIITRNNLSQLLINFVAEFL